jgi:hypothetical protein
MCLRKYIFFTFFRWRALILERIYCNKHVVFLIYLYVCLRDCMQGLCTCTLHYSETLEPLTWIRVCPSYCYAHTLFLSLSFSLARAHTCFVLCLRIDIQTNHSTCPVVSHLTFRENLISMLLLTGHLRIHILFHLVIFTNVEIRDTHLIDLFNLVEFLIEWEHELERREIQTNDLESN